MDLTLRLRPDTLAQIERIRARYGTHVTVEDVLRRALQQGLTALDTPESGIAFYDKVTEAVLAFARARVATPETASFRMRDLEADVRQRAPEAAPDSPSRLLRMLKKQGALDYQLESRGRSQYRLLWVR